MLEVASFRKLRAFGEKKVFVAEILDAALYYGRVHIYLDLATLGDLAECLLWAGLKTLLHHPSISATLLTEEAVIWSQGLPAAHSPVFMSNLISFDAHANQAPEHLIHRLLNQRGGALASVPITEIRKLVKKFRPVTYGRLLGDEGKNQALWTSLAKDPTTIKLAISALATANHGNANDMLLSQTIIRVFDVSPTGLIVDSTIPLERFVQIPTMPDLTWANVLAEINEFRLDMYFASNEASDLILTPTSAAFATARMDLAMNRGSRSQARIQHFNETVFENGKPLGELFLAGKIMFEDALRIIDQAEKFRDVIISKPHNTELMREYLNEVARIPWLDTVPGKFLRWLVCGGIGVATMPLNPAIGVGVGAAAGAFDSFFIPKIMDKWKPTLFVQSIERKLQA